MSITVLVGKERAEVEFIEWRPGEGLVFRVANEVTEAAFYGLDEGLRAALRGAPCAVYRTCCDSSPISTYHLPHGEGHENAKDSK
ncbi:MAG: hypothetical protein MUP14_07815 [Dehalococcoidia bacterium]|nr:hypothetical protein [Dehalococcoidia bacterium]